MSEENPNKFLNYLMEIGLIDDLTSQNLYNIYNNFSQNSTDTNFTNLMCATLIYFFNHMTEEQQKFSSLNLIMKYLNKENKKNENNLENESDKNKIDIKNETMKKKEKPNFTKIKNTKPKKISNINTENNNNLKKNIDNNNSNLLETSWDKKEREEYEKCTFEPLINKHNNSNLNENIPFYERLYNYNKIYKNKKDNKINEKEKKENEINSFKPKIISTPEKYRTKSKNSFEERQKLYFDNKKKNQQKLIGEINKDYNKNCSFTPKVNTGKKIDNYYLKNNDLLSPVHLRLYEDDQRRRNKKLQSVNNYNLKINEDCNSMSKEVPLVDYEKIEELYNQYKNKPLVIQKIKKKVENEEGITFQPDISKNNLYYDKIKSDFYERNMQILSMKQKFIHDYNQREEEKFKKNQLHSDKRYSQSEKDEITKRIIDRLYGDNNIVNNKKKDEKINLKEDDKYCDKIISLDEYNEGKIKKK